MFFRPRHNPPAWYRPIYLTLSTTLGIVLSYGLHAVVELWWLWYAQRKNIPITWTNHFGKGACALPPVVQYGLLALGMIGGFFLGKFWWRWVYVERRWLKT